MHRRAPLPLSGGWRSGGTGSWPMAEEGFRAAGEPSRDGPARLCQYWFNSGTVRIGAPVDRTGRCAFASLGRGLGVLQRFGAHGLAFAALGLRKRAVLLAAGAHASVEHRCRLFRFRLLLVRLLLLVFLVFLVFLRAHVDPFALCSRPF